MHHVDGDLYMVRGRRVPVQLHYWSACAMCPFMVCVRRAAWQFNCVAHSAPRVGLTLVLQRRSV